jgi:hypothetical protein
MPGTRKVWYQHLLSPTSTVSSPQGFRHSHWAPHSSFTQMSQLKLTSTIIYILVSLQLTSKAEMASFQMECQCWCIIER